MARVLVYSTGDIEALVPILADAGHRVTEAYDASEAVRLVIQGQLDVVMIPELPEPFDGEDLLPLIRRLTHASVVVVGAGDETAIASALLQGADEYLRFPIDAPIVQSRIRALLRRRRRAPGRTGEQGSDEGDGTVGFQQRPGPLPIEELLDARGGVGQFQVGLFYRNVGSYSSCRNALP